MAHGDAMEGKWRGNWRTKWVASTLHTTSEHGVSSITTADAHTSAVSSRLNWRPRCFKWTRMFRRKTKSGFCACAITFQTQSICSQLLTSVALISVRLKILQTVNMKTATLWDVTLCSLIDRTFVRLNLLPPSSGQKSRHTTYEDGTDKMFRNVGT